MKTRSTFRITKLLKWLGIIIFCGGAMLIICACPPMSFYLSDAELGRLKLEVARGSDGEAVKKVADYYTYYKSDYNEQLHWLAIGAENGNLYGTKGLLILLTVNKENKEALTRSIFWLYIMESVFQYDIDKSFNLEDLGYYPGTTKPPNDTLFPSASSFSEANIARYKEGALQGSGQAALVLANYYDKVARDAGEAEYWYRIGAQDGNTECMKQYGNILLVKNEMLEQERGKFWLARASGMGQG